MKRKDKTTLKQIADYWIKNNHIDETELNFDWSEAHTHCWNCGDNKYRKSTKKAPLQRCHIIPHSLGGEDTPSNYVLLCKECHAEGPNTSNTNDMWDWIRSNRTFYPFYDTYTLNKALTMFNQKEGYPFLDKALGIENFNDVLKSEMDKLGSHFLKINSVTYYYMFKNIIDNHT